MLSHQTGARCGKHHFSSGHHIHLARMIVLAPDRRIIFFNKAFAAITGYDEIAGEDLQWSAEHRFMDTSNGILILEDLSAIIRNADGKAIRLLGSMTDVTEQREPDARLRKSQKSEARDMVDLVAKASRHGADLTSRLLSFARHQPLEPKTLRIEEQLAAAVNLLNRVLPENITIAVESAADLWQVEADAGQLESALVNLSLNAKDAMPAGGRLTLAASNYKVTSEFRRIDPELKPGDYVQLRVTDSGTGIPADILEKVSDPFFTTKPIGEGTGLGLSMVYGFAKQSGGHVSVSSEVGVGTTVQLLPRAHEKQPAAQASGQSNALPGGTETILLVEDNDVVRANMLKQLQMLGYSVITSCNGAEGLAELERPQDIDLLFSDIVMPGDMDGIRLADAARALRPDLKILLTSGYSENAIIDN